MELEAAIQDHLELRRRNAGLAPGGLDRYREEVARGEALPLERQGSSVLEETREYAPAWLAVPESANLDSDWGWEEG